MSNASNVRDASNLEQLFRLSHNDPTIRAFLNGWSGGQYGTFDVMLCALVVQLAAEKAEYLKTAIKAVQDAPPRDVLVVESLDDVVTESLNG